MNEDLQGKTPSYLARFRDAKSNAQEGQSHPRPRIPCMLGVEILESTSRDGFVQISKAGLQK